MFEFQDPGRLVDGDLELRLSERYPGDPRTDWVPSYRFRMVHARTGEEMGRIDLRVGYPQHLVLYGGNIGYRVEPRHRGHHYAARACRLLLPLARSHGMQTLWITCNPDNWASRRTCELAGAVGGDRGPAARSDMYRRRAAQVPLPVGPLRNVCPPSPLLTSREHIVSIRRAGARRLAEGLLYRRTQDARRRRHLVLHRRARSSAFVPTALARRPRSSCSRLALPTRGKANVLGHYSLSARGRLSHARPGDGAKGHALVGPAGRRPCSCTRIYSCRGRVPPQWMTAEMLEVAHLQVQVRKLAGRAYKMELLLTAHRPEVLFLDGPPSGSTSSRSRGCVRSCAA